MRSMSKYGLLIVAILLFAYMGIFEGFEKKNLYFPTREIEAEPSDIGLSFENVYLKTEDGITLHGWFIPKEKSHYVILHCHGNAGNISHRLHDIERFHKFGFNVFIFDYRGYGKSEGSPSEQGTYLDAQAAYRYLLKERGFEEREIAVFGRSLGGSVAIDLCTRESPAGLICESTFTSTAAMAEEIYPFLPVKWFITMKYDSLSKVGHIEIPKLFLHSIEDEMIGFHHGKQLFEAAAPPKELFQMRGGHNDGFMVTPGYHEAIQKFLERIFGESS